MTILLFGRNFMLINNKRLTLDEIKIATDKGWTLI